MCVQVDNRQDAGLGLETQHALIVRLILPSGAVYHRRALVIASVVPVYVTGDEYVGHGRDDHPVLGFWG